MIIAICDDKNEIIEQHKEKTLEIAEKHNVPVEFCIFHDGKELIDEYQTTRLDMDLLYVDMNMPRMKGDEAVERLRDAGYENEVVFFTISTNVEHFKKAFKHGALEYIIKGSSTEEELETIFLKAVKRYSDREKEYITLSFAGETRNIFLNEISYFEYIDKKIYVHYANNEVFAFFDTLTKLEKQLEFHGFLRIYSGYLVNMYNIHVIKRGIVQMKNGEELFFNKKRTVELRATFDSYMGIDNAEKQKKTE